MGEYTITPNIVPPAVGQNLRFDFGRDGRIGRLQRRDGRDFRDTLHLLRAEIRYADPAHLAFLFQLRQFAPTLFNVFLGLRPVNLVEVDYIHFEAAQTGFALLANGIRLEHAADFAFSFHVRSHLVKRYGLLGRPSIAPATTLRNVASP